MNRVLKGLFSLGFLLSTGMIVAHCCSDTGDCCSQDCEAICGGGYPYFSIRSQSINAARELVGWQTFINRFGMEEAYGAFSITAEFTRSFRPCKLAGFFFGDDIQDGKLTISGSRKGSPTYTARGEHDWLADYFGLSPDFESTVKFTPRISNFLVDLNFYVGLDKWWRGAFFKVHAPIVYTRWDLNMCEEVVTRGSLGFDEGYMDSVAVPYTDLPINFATAMKGVTWGDMQEKLKYGKISDCKKTIIRLSDIEVALGWNFIREEGAHLGLMVRASFPTGNKPCAEYLFEPIVGSGGHFMLGGGLTSHVRIWKSDDEESDFCAYMDANIGHYFKKKQWRSFDLKNKKNSRYMLVQEMGTPTANLYAGDSGEDDPAPSHQYKENLFPLINKTTCCTDVNIAVQGNMVVKLAYTNGCYSCDVGYGLWARTGEKFNQEDCCKTCCLEEENKYALKGDAHIIGFDDTNNNPYGLSATESKATINSGTNTPNGQPFTTSYIENPNIDNPLLAWSDNSDLPHELETTIAGATQTRTSYQPKLLACDDLNLCDTPAALSHKFFVHLNYMREKKKDCDWTPFLGFGAEVEFSGRTQNKYSALSQWGVWIKGGISFE